MAGEQRDGRIGPDAVRRDGRTFYWQSNERFANAVPNVCALALEIGQCASWRELIQQRRYGIRIPRLVGVADA
jgi:hypothetical protein